LLAFCVATPRGCLAAQQKPSAPLNINNEISRKYHNSVKPFKQKKGKRLRFPFPFVFSNVNSVYGFGLTTIRGRRCSGLDGCGFAGELFVLFADGAAG
jgi:hypothetical protein